MSDNDEIRTDDIRPDEENTAAELTAAGPENSAQDAQDGLPDVPLAEVIPETDEAESASEESPLKEQPTESEEKPRSKKPLRVPLFIAVIAILAAAVLASQITFLSVRQSYHNKLATIEKGRFSDSKLSEVDEIYRKYYINGVKDDQLVDGLIEGYIYGAGDKYGNYMSSEEYAEYANDLNSKTVGIGVSVIWDSSLNAIEVMNVYEGSPAEEAGMMIGDLIVEVDGKDVSELGFDAGVAAVKGEAETTVRLTIMRGENHEETLQLDVVRREITVKTVTLKTYGEVAVIGISNFHAATLTELKTAVSSATEAGCDRIVFDLRNNTGGLLVSVQGVLDYILPECVTVRTLNAAGEWTEYRSDASCLKMPMVVIVNGRTASAAELFTSSLKDNGYATVIGTQTYGKGTVTTPFRLSDGSVIYISTDHYYPPVSDNFEGVGITPDEVLELDDEAKNINFYKLTYETDNQLRRAIEIIKEK